ncbi:hypothetical protein VNO80_08581 [Phaseolus coccineus]|uniref:Uncharacterized protein n=1 Tax=Phaseolus coccineus TaxID=3886 RepID=A0AAN9RBU5_PHACN
MGAREGRAHGPNAEVKLKFGMATAGGNHLLVAGMRHCRFACASLLNSRSLSSFISVSKSNFLRSSPTHSAAISIRGKWVV